MSEERVAEWFSGLRFGADLTRGDPRLALRNLFITHYKMYNRSEARRMTWGLITKAWNAFHRDERIIVLRYATTEPMPLVWGAKV